MVSFVRFLLLLCMAFLESCSSAKQSLVLHTLPNYDPSAVYRILFMDFTISRTGPGQPEQVTLTNAILGNGEMKNGLNPVHTPYQIKLVRHYTSGQDPQVDPFEHPLFRSIELANTNGTLSRTLTSESSGHLSVRFPYTKALTKIELYSVTPDGGTQKIYTLQIKL